MVVGSPRGSTSITVRSPIRHAGHSMSGVSVADSLCDMGEGHKPGMDGGCSVRNQALPCQERHIVWLGWGKGLRPWVGGVEFLEPFRRVQLPPSEHGRIRPDRRVGY